MKPLHPWSRHRSAVLRVAVALLPLALGASACELIASVDRSKIDDGAGASTGEAGQPGQGGSGGTAGAAPSDAGSGNDTGEGGEPSGGRSGEGGEPSGGGNGAAGEGGAAPAIGGAAGETSSAGASGEAGSAGAGGEHSGPAGKVIYLTGTPKKANFGGISGADAECNASPPSSGGTFKALIVDGTTRAACTTASCSGGASEHIDWVLAPDTTYVRPDNTVIGTTNSAGIFVFPLDASIADAGYTYWTGLSDDWTSSSDDCGDWSATSGYFANEGLGDATDSQAIAGVSESCATLAGAFFACVEQ